MPPQQQSIIWEGSEGRSTEHWGQENSSCLPRSLLSAGDPCVQGERVSAPRSAAQLPELDFACSTLFIREPFHHRSVLFSWSCFIPLLHPGAGGGLLEEGLGNKAMHFSSMLFVQVKRLILPFILRTVLCRYFLTFPMTFSPGSSEDCMNWKRLLFLQEHKHVHIS